MKPASIYWTAWIPLMIMGTIQSLAESEPLNPTDSIPHEPIAITVYIDDSKGFFYPDTEWTRENLLQEALHHTSRSTQHFRIEKLVYNESVPENATHILALRVLAWQRSHSGFYEFRAFAHYFDSEGTRHALGSLTGIQSDLHVTTRYDVREAFVDAVEMALREAFRKLERLRSVPA